MRGLFQKENWHRIWDIAPVLTVGIIGVAASIFFWYLTFASENRAFVQEFDGQANNQAIILQNGIDEYWDKLYAVRALFDSSNHDVTREEFESFSQSLIGGRAAILNVAWIPHVKREERVAHEAAAVRDGLLDYHIRGFGPDGKLSISPERNEYFPKFYSTESRGRLLQTPRLVGIAR
jgi:CHASE1-domain containing sensor protein